MKQIILILFLVFPLLAVLGQDRPNDNWVPFRVFIGEWKGKGGGQPGEGDYERSYKFVLSGKFIEIKNKSTYKPQPKNPKGEVHEDVGYISYDKTRKTFVLRQFHKEGFVNQYRLESISPDGKKIVFISEAIENIPEGWRARETYQILGKNKITEIFDLAAPGKDFEIYSKATLRKIKTGKQKR